MFQVNTRTPTAVHTNGKYANCYIQCVNWVIGYVAFICIGCVSIYLSVHSYKLWTFSLVSNFLAVLFLET